MWKRIKEWWNRTRIEAEARIAAAESIKDCAVAEAALYRRRLKEMEENRAKDNDSDKKQGELRQMSMIWHGQAITLQNKHLLHFDAETKIVYKCAVVDIAAAIVSNLEARMEDQQIAKMACDCADAIFAEVDERWAKKQELKK